MTDNIDRMKPVIAGAVGNPAKTCAKGCEGNAYQIEIRRQKECLEDVRKERDGLMEALKACRDQFQHYVQHHLDKGNLDKAAQNERFVALADAAIASVEAPKNGD